jgi:hypothetical protein
MLPFRDEVSQAIKLVKLGDPGVFAWNFFLALFAPLRELLPSLV